MLLTNRLLVNNYSLWVFTFSLYSQRAAVLTKESYIVWDYPRRTVFLTTTKEIIMLGGLKIANSIDTYNSHGAKIS